MSNTWQIEIVTIYPDIVRSYADRGVLRAASNKGIARVSAIDLRDFAVDKHGSIDDQPYGGGDGMVMRPEPLKDAVLAAKNRIGSTAQVISMSPAGKRWSQSQAESFAKAQRPLVVICGRFGGLDQRFIDRYVDEEYSIGDFVLAGGELAALVVVESSLRLVPGVLGHEASPINDSFSVGMDHLLEYPQYTRPRDFDGDEVPEVLLSGRHADIAAWRSEASRRLTEMRRPDLFQRKP